MKIRLIIFFLAIASFAFAQNQFQIDSLKIGLENASEDSLKVNLMFKISELYYRVNVNQSLEYAREAFELSKKIKDPLFLTRARLKVGSCYIIMGNYNRAMENYLAAQKLAEKNNFKSEKLISLSNLGIVHDRIGQFDAALKYHFDALNEYNESFSNVETTGSFKNIQGLYNNIGNIYLTKGELDKAEDYYKKGLEISVKSDDLVNTGTICNNLGKLELQRKNYELSLEYLNKSLAAREKNNDRSGIAKTYYLLANYYFDTGDNPKALDFAQKSLKLSIELKEPVSGQIASMFLYQIYKNQEKYREALEAHELFKQISDSLVNETNIKEITSLQMKAEFDKQEQEKEVEREKAKQTYLFLTSVLLLGLIILGLLFVLNQARHKRVRLEHEQMGREMVMKNKELATNVIYLLQKNELIDNITERLLKLKSLLKGENVDKLQKIIIDLQSTSDKEVWTEFEYRFQSVHEEFYQALQKKFPDLSPSEIRLAAFLRLNMTTKEISSITGQSVNSLETARYRLRKKLGITNQEVNLVNFLLNI